MIIVSQDKKAIHNFDNLTQIYITQDEEKTAYYIRIETVDSLYDDLGEYKTEERAKEILREIINLYEVAKRYEVSSNNGITILLDNKFVYEMPED